MIFQKYEVNEKDGGYEVILHMKPSPALEEFAEEFGLTKKAEEDINRVAISYVKKKFPTLRVKAIKVMMGGALVTTIMFGGNMTKAFAEENGEQVQAETTTTEEEPVTEPTPEEPVEEETTEEVPMDDPGLVPGDFFYFVEAISEKVQLAFTFDDTAKAELISQFANERIAEADALFESGDTEGAINLLNKALESQDLALDYVAEEENPDETAPEEDLASPEGDLPPEETEGELAPTEDGDAVKGEEDTTATDEDPATKVRDELQAQFSQNITALLLAMEKVENPKAKAALAKNVEKAYAKMEKKLGKMKGIEEGIATAIPVDEDVEDLRADIRNDQADFESDMAEAEEQDGASVVPPVVPKKAQEKAQTGQEKAREGQSKAAQGAEKAGKGQEKASQGKQTGQEKQAEKRASTTTPKNEMKATTTPVSEKAKGNTKAGGNAKAETEVNADVEAGEEVAPTPRGNQEKGNKGKENQGKGRSSE